MTIKYKLTNRCKRKNHNVATKVYYVNKIIKNT